MTHLLLNLQIASLLSHLPPPPLTHRPLTHVAHVIKEMVTTEKAYVGALSEIIEVRLHVYCMPTYMMLHVYATIQSCSYSLAT